MTHLILVHGMAATAKSWFDLPTRLSAAGHKVANVQLPGHLPSRKTLTTTMSDYVEAVAKRFSSSTKSTLIGHSMGGAVISHVAAAQPDKIEALFYVAAMCPAEGETIREVSGKSGANADSILQEFEDAGVSMSDGVIGLQPPLPFLAPMPASDDIQTINRRHVITLDDRILPEDLQRAMAGAYPGAETKDLASGHVPQATAPDDLAKILLDWL